MNDSETPLVSIVLPTYNERENIETLVPKILDVFKENNLRGELIIVDDNSPDGTGEFADILAKKFPSITVIHRKVKSGLGSAYKVGFKKASGKVVMECDADHSHNPRDIPRLVEAVFKGYDLAIGSRYIAGGNIIGWGIYRKMVSKGANTLAALILQINKFVKDVTSGYRAYRVKVLNTIDMSAVKSSGYAFQLDMLVETLRNGFKVKEVPITFVDRRIGESKLGFSDILGFFLTVLRVRFKKLRF